MKKATTTALFSLLVMLVFFSTSVAIQSCGDKKPERLEEEFTEEELSEKLENVADAYSDDDIFEEDDIDTEATYEQKESLSANQSVQSAPLSNNAAFGSSSSPYLIVAGNYLLENNAVQMVKTLQQKGYNGAEKVVFDLSQYYTVLAGRYPSRSAANAASKSLKKAGIDNYVIKKK